MFGQLRSIRPPANPGEFDFAAYSRAAPAVGRRQRISRVRRHAEPGLPLSHRPDRRIPAHPRRVAFVAQCRPAAQRTGGGHVPGRPRRTRARRHASLSRNRHDPPAGHLGPQRRHSRRLPVLRHANRTGPRRLVTGDRGDWLRAVRSDDRRSASRRASHGNGAGRLPGNAARAPRIGVQFHRRRRAGRVGAESGRVVSSWHATVFSLGGRVGLVRPARRQSARARSARPPDRGHARLARARCCAASPALPGARCS